MRISHSDLNDDEMAAALWESAQGRRVEQAELAHIDWLVSTGAEVRPANFQSPAGIAYAHGAVNDAQNTENDVGNEGVGNEGVGAEGEGAEGVGAEGVGAEGVGAGKEVEEVEDPAGRQTSFLGIHTAKKVALTVLQLIMRH